MKKIPMFLTMFIVLISTGCGTIRLTDFTVISTKNVTIPATKGNRVQGKDCADLLLWFIPLTGSFNPDLKEAIDKALEQGGGDVLIDGVVYQDLIITFIYNRICYRVEGTVANTAK